jgi:hypothetical protein
MWAQQGSGTTAIIAHMVGNSGNADDLYRVLNRVRVSFTFLRLCLSDLLYDSLSHCQTTIARQSLI